jgi:hypothetical protein
MIGGTGRSSLVNGSAAGGVRESSMFEYLATSVGLSIAGFARTTGHNHAIARNVRVSF